MKFSEALQIGAVALSFALTILGLAAYWWFNDLDYLWFAGLWMALLAFAYADLRITRLEDRLRRQGVIP